MWVVKLIIDNFPGEIEEVLVGPFPSKESARLWLTVSGEHEADNVMAFDISEVCAPTAKRVREASIA